MTASISAANPSVPARRATRAIGLLGCLFVTLLAWALGRAPSDVEDLGSSLPLLLAAGLGCMAVGGLRERSARRSARADASRLLAG